jgi:hypothetical protein
MSVLGSVAQTVQVNFSGFIPLMVAGGIINGFEKKFDGSSSYKASIAATSICQMIFSRYLGIQGLGWGLVGGSLVVFGLSISHRTSTNDNYKKMAPTMALVGITSFALTLLADRALGGQLLPIVATTEIGKATITKVLAAFMCIIIALPVKPESPRDHKYAGLAHGIAIWAVSTLAPFPNVATIGLFFVSLSPLVKQVPQE